MGKYDTRLVLLCHSATPDLIWLCAHPPVNAETLSSKVGSTGADAGRYFPEFCHVRFGPKADILGVGRNRQLGVGRNRQILGRKYQDEVDIVTVSAAKITQLSK